MKTVRQKIAAFLDRAGKQLSYFVEKPILEFTESVVSRMAELRISNSEMAEKLNCKPSYVTKVLRGSTNFTLESMVKIALVLDCDLSPIKLVPRTCSEKYADINLPPRPTIDWRREVKAFSKDAYKPTGSKANTNRKDELALAS